MASKLRDTGTTLKRLAELERRFNGPIPTFLIDAAMAGSRVAGWRQSVRAAEIDHSGSRLRAAIGRRRRALSEPLSADGDPWLRHAAHRLRALRGAYWRRARDSATSGGQEGYSVD